MGISKLLFMNVLLPQADNHYMPQIKGLNDFNLFSPGGFAQSTAINCNKSQCNTLITADTLESHKSEVKGSEKQSTKCFSELTVSKFTSIKSNSNEISFVDLKSEISSISTDPTDYKTFWRPSQLFHDINSKMNGQFEENLEMFEATLQKLVAASNEYLTEDFYSNQNPNKVRKYFELPKEYSMADAQHTQRRKITKMIKNS